ncbi:MAG: hypothetical protein UX91_C0006G0219 [Candidatus Amesbacteria bacterium GW2011_GWB1_47_19]|nr:MAG: hypothetical protein UW51_C0002G0220 [Candidatus Amesbacteria bacterium GW2011_GWA1_44_24]KKU30999.1 MAG: hypothetical protein UX46_C0008G0019 [Candidatus Amesbacteria bacterium GW2011_GWC1_46_24]KKU67157.1 MAG: hypothetical protein UX91_C0006G0219 [Candidatus Amesbacteria bacterium GW2011_GWB1_47_19]
MAKEIVVDSKTYGGQPVRVHIRPGEGGKPGEVVRVVRVPKSSDNKPRP